MLLEIQSFFSQYFCAASCTVTIGFISSCREPSSGFFQEFSLPSITLFERCGLRGKRVVLTDGTVNLPLAAGCSRVQSLIVGGGMWVQRGLIWVPVWWAMKPLLIIINSCTFKLLIPHEQFFLRISGNCIVATLSVVNQSHPEIYRGTGNSL